jgi:glutamate synthase (NADPH/NADH) large chain/glutamate synthase (ferredoxin)
MVTLQRLSGAEEISALKGIIYKHLEMTESGLAKEILGDWARFEPLFWKVVPQPPAIPATAAALAPAVTAPATPSASSEPAKA